MVKKELRAYIMKHFTSAKFSSLSNFCG